MKEFKYYTVDVFTDSKFGGNQLAVISNAENIDKKLYQSIANEFNYSETTFILPPNDPKNDFCVRIFTPAVEVPMAGHPTVGSAYILLNRMHYRPKSNNKLLLEEKVGLITVDFDKTNNTYQNITMNQPLPEFGGITKEYNLIAELLSINESDIDHDKPIEYVSCGMKFLFVPVKSLEILSRINLKLDLFKKYENNFETLNLYVFTMQTVDQKSDTHARMFAPLLGISEDPATGSASGPFGCYLHKNGITDKGKIVCEQGYEMKRPSKIIVEIGYKDYTFEYVRVGGNVVPVCEGMFSLD